MLCAIRHKVILLSPSCENSARICTRNALLECNNTSPFSGFTDSKFGRLVTSGPGFKAREDPFACLLRHLHSVDSKDPLLLRHLPNAWRPDACVSYLCISGPHVQQSANVVTHCHFSRKDKFYSKTSILYLVRLRLSRRRALSLQLRSVLSIFLAAVLTETAYIWTVCVMYLIRGCDR